MACSHSRKATRSPAEKSVCPSCSCTPAPWLLYTANRAPGQYESATVGYLIVQKLERCKNYKRRQGENQVERDGEGHAHLLLWRCSLMGVVAQGVSQRGASR